MFSFNKWFGFPDDLIISSGPTEINKWEQITFTIFTIYSHKTSSQQYTITNVKLNCSMQPQSVAICLTFGISLSVFTEEKIISRMSDS
ncbi:hypothetical protein V144x_35940 [Gimesia aquarii]|uniref:Uncharacterized protein n=1 Tax=Gimesia aquarii TaxID=2527964 RepID=A0A517VYQ0_9PLAN|nr:hypothetical protein V144x_35940 [Gimesia aquarii]